MKKVFFVALFAITLIGCSSVQPQSVPTNFPKNTLGTPKAVLETDTVTSTVSPTHPIRTPTPSETLTPTLESVPTSNFDKIKFTIFTPAPPAICPQKSQTDIEISTALPQDEVSYQSGILKILNQGGIHQLLTYLKKNNSDDYNYVDLTNDGVDELILRTPLSDGNVNVFGCQNGSYVKLLSVTRVYDYGPGILAVKDVNKDGVNELVLDLLTCHYCSGILVYEWNGQGFENLVRNWYIDDQTNKLAHYDIAELGGYTFTSINDIDNNGTYELILDGGIPSYLSAQSGYEGPWRGQKVIYMWDGHYYVWYSQKYSSPNFRFEAVQDGDTEAAQGDYDAAISSYQAAIFNDKLKSWTSDVWQDLIHQNEQAQSLAYPDITKMPFNQTEYDQLSAYARYRIMIIYLKQGWDSDAQVIYQTLQEKYAQENPGHPYVEMATEFWNEYQISSDLASACDKTIAYVTNHQEILEPLGSHGLWDNSYSPYSICPFQKSTGN